MSLAHPQSGYLYEDPRFIILEDYGCSSSILVTWISLIFVFILPIVLEIIAGVYGFLSIRAFYNRSKKPHINDFNFDPNRYISLMCISAFDLLCGIPFTSFYLYLAITVLSPFTGLKQEHSDYSDIEQLPAAVWRADTLNAISYELNRWIVVVCAFVFFVVFGFTEESRNNYRATFQYVVQVFVKTTGIKTRPQVTSSCNAEGCVIIGFFFFFSSSDTMIFRIVFQNSHNNSTFSGSSNDHRHNNAPV